MRVPMPGILTCLAAVCLSAAASAHAFLEKAEPPVGATVSAVPSTVLIQFTEGLEPLFSRIEVRSADGQRVDDGRPHLADNNAKRFAIGLKPLSPGTYKVIWHATSVDTHKTDGTYQFTVKP